jgi:hypothetical protein
MIDLLIQRAESLRAGFQVMLRDFFGSGDVQGATMEIDPYWYEWAVRQHGFTGENWFTNFLRHFPYQDYREWKFDVLPKDWNNYCEVMGYGEATNPLVIRIILRHPIEQDVTGLGSLPRTYNGYPLLYEVRPPVVATGLVRELSRFIGLGMSDGVLNPVSVGRAEPRTSGTLGGFLRCLATDRYYLVSCAHVFGTGSAQVYTPGPFENLSSTPIGVIRFAEIPPLKGAGQDCNLDAVPNAGRLDLAVAEWIPPGNIAQAIAPKPSVHIVRRCAKMNPYQPISFVGKVSGLVQAQLSAVTLWHEIEIENFGDGPMGIRCFGSLFEMCDAQGDRQELAKPGDSGAWVFDDFNDQRCWNGILIAHQGKRAYGCYAEYIMRALNNHAAFPGGLAIQW